MPVQRPIFDYTNRDYEALLESLLDTAATKFPEWTDRSENDIGRLLLELFAQVGDVLLYYQDRMINESFLSTAVERRSVIDLLGLIGYKLGTPAAASVELMLTAPNDSTDPVQVQPGARFATTALPGRPAVEFSYLPVSDSALVVPRDGSGGIVNTTFTVLQADRVADEVLGTSTGDANQILRPVQHPVLLPGDPGPSDSLTVEVDPGGGFERWERQETLLYSRSNDPHYVVRITDEDGAEIVFGDATYGRIPPAGSVIRVTYLIGGGADGNVGSNTIVNVKSGVNVRAAVTNQTAASGGAERESIEHARRLAPFVYRSMQRTVTATDHAALAENVPGVARARAVAPAWNYVDVFVVGAGGLAPTDRLRADVLEYLRQRAMITTLVTVRQPVFVRIDIAATVGVLPTYYQVDVERRVQTAIGSLFEIASLSFGQSFYLSKIYEAIEATSGVAFSQVTTFAGYRSDPPGEPVDPGSAGLGLIQLRDGEFPRQGTLTITVDGGLT